MNQAIIVGRLGNEPEIKYFESGTCLSTFSLAVNRYVSKTKETVTDWFSIQCWGKLAEFAAEHLKKGKTVVVEGAFIKETFTTKEGEEKTVYKISANKISFDGAFSILSGTIESVEDTSDKIQTIKLLDNDAKITYYIRKDKIYTNGETVTFVSSLGMTENKEPNITIIT